jgi:hypothetical protein
MNSKLPRAARPNGWVYLLLLANFVFFGFVFDQFTGDALIKF